MTGFIPVYNINIKQFSKLTEGAPKGQSEFLYVPRCLSVEKNILSDITEDFNQAIISNC